MNAEMTEDLFPKIYHNGKVIDGNELPTDLEKLRRMATFRSRQMICRMDYDIVTAELASWRDDMFVAVRGIRHLLASIMVNPMDHRRLHFSHCAPGSKYQFRIDYNGWLIAYFESTWLYIDRGNPGTKLYLNRDEWAKTHPEVVIGTFPSVNGPIPITEKARPPEYYTYPDLDDFMKRAEWANVENNTRRKE